jgi:hypothetical protein
LQFTDSKQAVHSRGFPQFKNYDVHHVLKYFSKRLAAKYDEDKKESFEGVEITALNLEKYISFKIQYLRFIDSYQFLSAGLEKIVQNVRKNRFVIPGNISEITIYFWRKEFFPMNGSTALKNSTKRNYRPWMLSITN